MGDFNETFLYHYTNVDAYSKILREKTLLKSSKDRNGTNQRYGPGVYLTSLKPETGCDKIKIDNRDGAALKPKYADKTEEYYFKFNKRNLPGVERVEMKGGRDVWRFPNDINLSTISFYYGYTDEPESETYQRNNSSPNVHAIAKTGLYDYEEHSNQAEKSFGRSRGNDVYGSSQQQQEPETSGLGLVAGTAAVLAVGAVAFGLFAASRQANRNNQ
ncbi:uncharacterized protein LOC130693745 [Daphnia carinata]|uniref:uncharacterized protein LOC130693745 n=1 Tax=Daphnia carinata TaxID=120202 RepID=UPI00257F4F4D|nr:uncharacterized protein LOC130693745 [Daphnia carinata]